MNEAIRSRIARVISVICAVFLFAGADAMGQQHSGRLERISAVLEGSRTEIVEIRRDIHRHPEVSGKEERTARVVASRLRSLGLEVKTDVGGHGVVGVLRGRDPGGVVAFRADMDAVFDSSHDPVEFRSLNPGIRHICGHDIHTAVGLAVAEALSNVRDDLPGTVKFIFQPSEENVQGALAMIEDGVLNDPSPTAIFAFHSAPLEVGVIGAVEGLGLPGLDRVTVTIEGDGDADRLARIVAQAISEVSTVGPPGSGSTAGTDYVYSWARVAPESSNHDARIVQGFVKASGEEQYRRAKETITRRVAELTPGDLRTRIDYRDRVLPDMINDSSLVNGSLEAIRTALGESGQLVMSSSSPYFGEDFSYYQQLIPGAMYWLGVSNSAQGMLGMPHSPMFHADEEAIFVGAKVMSAVLVDYLDQQRPASDG